MSENPTEKKDESKHPPVYGVEHAPTLYVDNVDYLVFDGTTIRFRFNEHVPYEISNGETKYFNRVGAHVVMKMQTFMQITQHFNNVVRQYEKMSPAVEDIAPIRNPEQDKKT